MWELLFVLSRFENKEQLIGVKSCSPSGKSWYTRREGKVCGTETGNHAIKR